MKNETGCDFEQKIIQSSKSGFFDDALRNHLKKCADCAETSKVAVFFQTNLRLETAPKRLPTAGYIYWKSKMREKHLAAEKIARTNLFTQIVFALLVVAAFGEIVFFLPEYFSPVAAVMNQTLQTLEQSAGYLFMIIGTLTMIFAATFFALTRLTADE